MSTQEQLVSSVSDYSRTTALLLCIFLGIFGAHRFYVRKTASAFGMIFLTLLFGCGLFWVAADIVSILSGLFIDGSGHHVTSWSGSSRSQRLQSDLGDLDADYNLPRTIRKQDKEMVCRNCGSVITEEEIYCRSCGTALSTEL